MLKVHSMKTITLALLILDLFIVCRFEEWEDPYEMIPETRVSESVARESCNEVRERLTICNKQLENQITNINNNINDNNNNNNKGSENISELYFNKLLILLSNKFCNNYNLPATGDFQTIFSLAPSHCQSLQKPFSNPRHLTEIYSLLEDILSDHQVVGGVEEVTDGAGWYRVDNTIFLIAMTPLCLWLLVHTSRRLGHLTLRSIFVFFLLLFLISIPWNWWHLYKKEVAEKRSRIMGDVPKDCNRQSWAVWVRSLLHFESTECLKYYEAMEVDPVWEVSPAKAVVVTLTKLVLDPVEQLGGSLSKFLSKFLGELPVLLQPFAMIILILLLLFSFLVLCKYRFRSLLFSIEPSPADRSEEVEMLQGEIAKLHKSLKDSQECKEAMNQLSNRATNPPINYAAGDAQQLTFINDHDTGDYNNNNSKNNNRSKHSISSPDIGIKDDILLPRPPRTSSSSSTFYPDSPVNDYVMI